MVAPERVRLLNDAPARSDAAYVLYWALINRRLDYLHDRPWTERPIFGMIRYMNLAGMQRKTKVDAYIEAQQK